MADPKDKGILLDFLTVLYKDVREKVLDRAKSLIHKGLLEAKQRLVGQTVAVLGPPAAGKTTLLKVLKNPNADRAELTAYEKTEVSPNEAFKVDFLLTLGGHDVRFKFKVRKNADVGGEDYLRDGQWRQVVEGAHVIVYVADGERLLGDDAEYRARVLRDFDWMLQNTQLMRPGFKVVLAVNKIDTLCDAKTYRVFVQEQQAKVDALRAEVAAQWPDHLAKNLAPAVFVSLLDPTLRQFTLNGMMLAFVGTDLRLLLEEEAARDA